jgi:hypothetical protein
MTIRTTFKKIERMASKQEIRLKHLKIRGSSVRKLLHVIQLKSQNHFKKLSQNIPKIV